MSLSNQEHRAVEAKEPHQLSREVSISAGRCKLEAFLTLPVNPKGIVIFAHGSGSSRHSVRNRKVAGLLNDNGFATLLADLLTAEEAAIDERTSDFRFDIGLLAKRLGDVTTWTGKNGSTEKLGIGYFGASTGAAAAIIAAARHPQVCAVVSRGGRVDLAADFVKLVHAPVRLIVGSRDEVVLDLNRQVLHDLDCVADLCVVPGASHLFEEPGALDEVARLASDWFNRFLGGGHAKAV